MRRWHRRESAFPSSTNDGISSGDNTPDVIPDRGGGAAADKEGGREGRKKAVPSRFFMCLSIIIVVIVVSSLFDLYAFRRRSLGLIGRGVVFLHRTTHAGNCGPDSDGDGYGDLCELCPNDPFKLAPFLCGCGVADTDSDGDGVPDCRDGCPADPMKVRAGQCGCGFSDQDSDGDGTADCLDACPSDRTRVMTIGGCGCSGGGSEAKKMAAAHALEQRQHLGERMMRQEEGGVEGMENIVEEWEEMALEVPLDSDSDGVEDCKDWCPLDRHAKRRPCHYGDFYRESDDEEETDLKNAFDGDWRKNKLVLEDMRRFPVLLQAVREMGPASRPSHNTGNKTNNKSNTKSEGQYIKATRSLDEYMFAHCYKDEDFRRMMTDPLCDLIWMRQTLHAPIRAMDKILSVITRAEEKAGAREQDERLKMAQSGGARLIQNRTNFFTYWKPCYGNTGSMEDYRGEILAFYVDRVLGMYRVPPVFPRYFSRVQLERWAEDRQGEDPHAAEKMQTILHHCGSPAFNETQDQHGNPIESDGVEGAAVGWLGFPVKQLGFSAKKKKARMTKYIVRLDVLNNTEAKKVYQERLRVNRYSEWTNRENLEYTLENTQANLFGIATGNMLKFDHNFFVMRARNKSRSITGPLAYIDNDRAQWRYSTQRLSKIYNHNPMSTICKFPQDVSRRIAILTYKLFHPTSSLPTLGELVLQAANVFNDSQHAPLFTPEMAFVMDQNMMFLMNQFSLCIKEKKIPFYNVFIEEPWKSEFRYQPLDGIVNMYRHNAPPKINIFTPENEWDSNRMEPRWGLQRKHPFGTEERATQWNRLRETNQKNRKS